MDPAYPCHNNWAFCITSKTENFLKLALKRVQETMVPGVFGKNKSPSILQKMSVWLVKPDGSDPQDMEEWKLKIHQTYIKRDTHLAAGQKQQGKTASFTIPSWVPNGVAYASKCWI